jgi:prepilin-type N-terminal cleavage/methylation domain-containing protein
MTRRFTLVEMMIVIAIILILAAIAVPEFNRMQLASKRSEVPLMVEGITTAEMAYDAAHDRFVSVPGYVPNGTFNKKTRAWVTTSNYQVMGYRPDGAVRGGYYSPLFGVNGVDTVGRCDVDADGTPTYFTSRIDNGVVYLGDTMVSLPDTY